MKVLLSYEDRVRPDSTAVYFKRACEILLGKENVIHVYPEHLDSAPPADFYLKIDDGLEQNRWNPELHPSAYYCIDCHIDLEWRKKLALEGRFDHIFFAQKSPLSEKWVTESLHWLPLAADEDQHYIGPKDKKYDVCFIGYFHSQHRQARIDLCDALFRSFPNFFFGNRYFRDMAQKFAESKLVFNKSLNQDINMRFFEAQMSGSALLTDVIPEIKELGYIDEVHYIGYTTEEEMLDKARYYIENEASREEIARRGFELTRTKHQYHHRVGRILDLMKQEASCPK